MVIRPDDTVVIRIARSEMGQGTLTGLAQLALDGSWKRTSFTRGGSPAKVTAPIEAGEAEIRYLKRKWGPYLDVVQAKGTTRMVVRVVR